MSFVQKILLYFIRQFDHLYDEQSIAKKKKKKRLLRCSIIYMFITANLKHLELKHVRRWCDDKNEWLCVTLSSAKFHTYDNFPKNTIVSRHCSVLQRLTSDITCLFFLRCYVLASRSGITTTCTVHDCTNTTAGGVSKDRASVLCKKMNFSVFPYTVSLTWVFYYYYYYYLSWP